MNFIKIISFDAFYESKIENYDIISGIKLLHDYLENP
jgi:hypothetical protein